MKHRAPLTERLLSRVPVVLIDYPFELFIAVWGLLAGVAGLAGLTRSSTLSQLLPPWAAALWTLSLVLSGVSIAIGLRARRYGTSVANGLALCACATAVYAMALITVGGSAGYYAGSLLVMVSLIASLRALYLRVRRTVSKRIERSRYITEVVAIEEERRRGER